MEWLWNYFNEKWGIIKKVKYDSIEDHKNFFFQLLEMGIITT